MGCPFNYCHVVVPDCPRCEEWAEARAAEAAYEQLPPRDEP